MKLRSLWLLAAAAIVAAGAAAMLFLALAPSAPPPAQAPTSGDAAATPRATAPVAASPLDSDATAPLPTVTPPRIGARPSAAASVSWKDVPVATRVADLGPGLARPVFDALAAARDQMEPCFEEDRGRTARRGDVRSDVHEGTAVILVHLESRQAGLDVVDTEVESRGTSSEDLVACVRTVLKGWPIDAPAAAPGRRYRLRYAILE